MDFRYRARSSDGKIIEGALRGESQTQVVGVLRSRGMFPISVEAKRAETREKRIVQAVEWIAEGKQRNWKYMGC